jgi:hypothetical protein
VSVTTFDHLTSNQLPAGGFDHLAQLESVSRRGRPPRGTGHVESCVCRARFPPAASPRAARWLGSPARAPVGSGIHVPRGQKPSMELGHRA